tara:strand:+ start:848 stop:1249 length:402 start_codon:yes stop_codon:yes gene_type:complete
MGLTADQLRGRVSILIDGEEKFIRFGQDALAKIIDSLGLDGLSEIPSAISSLDGKTLSVLVWCGRLWEEPDLKLEEVHGLFFPLLPTYNSAVEAINLSLWGQIEPDFGGSEDDVDPTIEKERSGASSEQETLQ